MEIRCKIERQGGTQVVLGETSYHFRPKDLDGPHVATVEDADHAARFLSIVEGYEEVVATISPPDVRAQGLADPPADEPPLDPPPPKQYDGLSRAELVAAYTAKFDKVPHPATKDATIVKKLIDG